VVGDVFSFIPQIPDTSRQAARSPGISIDRFAPRVLDPHVTVGLGIATREHGNTAEGLHSVLDGGVVALLHDARQMNYIRIWLF
jgi:hypothetical protein